MKAPELNVSSMLSFYTSYGLIEMSQDPIEASSVSLTRSEKTKWALLDTGASHHMFNDESLFVALTLVSNNNPSQRLEIAGGGVSLAVKALGMVHLKAGDGSTFALNTYLLVPDLAKILISGGAMFKAQAIPVVHEGNTSNFSVVEEDLAIFNGTFMGNLRGQWTAKKLT